ncbi:thrombospondin type 3 repeat-containing protein [Cerasicoccus frondis]|uniref:thrombospondin type 3 repeat-containing protein n=1 Tax=Cerasicoccus frondis TaxID=490090 RepID=UPI0028526A54|nr:thrombospondin type 3 repeat-containing protein [Cerasicoccus frondis]
MNLNPKVTGWWELCLLSMACSSLHANVPTNWPTYYPEWWYDADSADSLVDVTKLGSGGQPGEEGNYSPLLLGQLKFFASKARDELDALYIDVGGAGDDINNLVDSFVTVTPENLSAVNLGQLKNVSHLYYRRLAALGFSETTANGGWPAGMHLDETDMSQGIVDNSPHYPWLDDSTVTNADLALVGQTKYLFSWDLSSFSAGSVDAEIIDWDLQIFGDGIADDWEYQYFGSNAVISDSHLYLDYDGDGLSNEAESALGTNPLAWDSDSDGIIDGAILFVSSLFGLVGDPVDAWEDQSGFENDLLPEQADERPAISANGPGGVDLVNFDGVNDMLKTTGIDGAQGDFTLIVAFCPTSLPSGQSGMALLGADSAQLQFSLEAYGSATVGGRAVSSGNLYFEGSSANFLFPYDGQNGQLPSDLFESDLWHVFIIAYDAQGEGGYIYKNGVLVGQMADVGAANFGSGLKFGDSASTPLGAKFLEILYFDRELTHDQIIALTQSYEARYGILSDRDSDGILDDWELEESGSLLTTDDPNDLSLSDDITLAIISPIANEML